MNMAVGGRGPVRHYLRRKASIFAGSVLVVGGLGLTSLGAGSAFAAGGTTTANASVASSITLSGLTSSFTLSGAPGATPSTNSAVSMNVTTNNRTGYNVTVQSASATMAATTTGNTDSVPIADLKARETGQPTFTSLSNVTANTVHNQATKSASSGDTITNDYQLVVPFVNSDTYTATLNYTASTNP
jgi:hypothetical protein